VTAPDDARRRHPAYARRPTPTPPGGAAGHLPTIICAALLTGLVAVLAPVLPYAAAICAVWTFAAFLLMSAWCAVCELVRARRFDRHVRQALRNIQ
jgi:hypothetical protein